ncbi:TetR/AcrR family transcriptional regulator [Lentzea sp. BCCO 10_0856]|uniref:TetR/AcrR family transcriptional regulator n=1 Tax=Lentzea miocenica TaxID=3095431 RepID=A0ABU4SUV2_9PSEU|nr:TetR/AcrR family transcriptional regulator [Lentzea sp. BCCO 10_0856]MDX8029686.1 TetR/AcrR family transcriptional regulator [Lentzea sp. BCCO 10_0856]
MPTGVHLRDVREQLFGAADRLLVESGPSALTSRAVTTEAGVAKGVLHRYFDDFDAFLADFVMDRVDKMDARAKALLEAAGTGTVVGNLAEAITAVFESVAVAIVALVTFRDDLRRRLRDTWPAGVPVLTDAAIMIQAYLEREKELGRVGDLDAEGVAPVLIGTGHLLFADRHVRPSAEAVRRMVESVVAPWLRSHNSE